MGTTFSSFLIFVVIFEANSVSSRCEVSVTKEARPAEYKVAFGWRSLVMDYIVLSLLVCLDSAERWYLDTFSPAQPRTVYNVRYYVKVGDRPMLAKQNKSVDSLPTDMSDNTESEEEGEVELSPPRLHHRSRPVAVRSSAPPLPPDRELLSYAAWRESRDTAAREVLTRTCALSVDDLFTLLFTNSKFFYDFQVRRRLPKIICWLFAAELVLYGSVPQKGHFVFKCHSTIKLSLNRCYFVNINFTSPFQTLLVFTSRKPCAKGQLIFCLFFGKNEC